VAQVHDGYMMMMMMMMMMTYKQKEIEGDYIPPTPGLLTEKCKQIVSVTERRGLCTMK